MPQGNAKFWTVEYYRPLFNVDTVQVLQRILRSLTPFRFGFIETAKTNPDLYVLFSFIIIILFIYLLILLMDDYLFKFIGLLLCFCFIATSKTIFLNIVMDPFGSLQPLSSW